MSPNNASLAAWIVVFSVVNPSWTLLVISPLSSSSSILPMYVLTLTSSLLFAISLSASVHAFAFINPAIYSFGTYVAFNGAWAGFTYCVAYIFEPSIIYDSTIALFNNCNWLSETFSHIVLDVASSTCILDKTI